MSKRAGGEWSKTPALTSTFSHPPPDATARVRRATQRASPGGISAERQRCGDRSA